MSLPAGLLAALKIGLLAGLGIGHRQYWHGGVGIAYVVLALFLTSKVPLKAAFSPTVWADVWATYATYDGSFADRRTYGFSVDVAKRHRDLSRGELAGMIFGFNVPWIVFPLVGLYASIRLVVEGSYGVFGS